MLFCDTQVVPCDSHWDAVVSVGEIHRFGGFTESHAVTSNMVFRQ